MIKVYSIYGDDIIGVFESKDIFLEYLKRKEFVCEVEIGEDDGVESFFINKKDGRFVDHGCINDCRLNEIWNEESL